MSLPEHALPDSVARGVAVVGDATIVLVEYLERWHGVTLDTEARARLLTGLIPLLLPDIKRHSMLDAKPEEKER